MNNTYLASLKRPSLFVFFREMIWSFFNINSSSKMTSEQMDELITRAVRDPQAFDDLYRLYVDRIYTYHLVRTNSREEAEDLTSQTFLAALEGISGYCRQGAFAVWLFGIARRKLVDHYRQPASLPLDLAEDLTGRLEDDIDHKLRLQQVSRALTKIEPDRVEALSLRIFGQLSTSEISRMLSKSEGAVRNLVYRALLDLRKQLVSDMEMEEE
jgi:RNA polymerase sigma-70 factor, ECF subfamily